MRIGRTGVLIGMAAAWILLCIVGAVRAHAPGDEPVGQGEPNVAGVVPPLLQYQGRLTDPDTGELVTDGDYPMIFRLYDIEYGGEPLWVETEDVFVRGGVFGAALGDTVPLDRSLFDGRALWLGVEVGADGEAEPRQRIVPVAYALSLSPGAVISTTSESPALSVRNVGSGDALQIDGTTMLNGDLSVSGSLGGGSHTHSWSDVTTGTVTEDRIASDIARDVEVTDIIDAHGSDPEAHHSRYTDDEAWAATLANDGSGSGLDADLLDGHDAGDFAVASHDHDDRYYTQGQSDGRFVNTAGPDAVSGSSREPMLGVTQMGSGVAVLGHNFGDGDGVQGLADGKGAGVFGYSDGGYGGHFIGGFGDALHVDGWTTMNGSLTVSGSVAVGGALAVSSDVEAERVTYSSPHTHTFVVGSEGFVPGSNVDYINTYGDGGAYVEADGFHALVAPVHLPQKAVTTAFEVFFYDGSSSDMTVCLKQQSLGGGGYWDLAKVSSSGTSGYYSRIDTSIEEAAIDNTHYSYCVYAYSSAWDGSKLRIKGALITYTISEAP